MGKFLFLFIAVFLVSCNIMTKPFSANATQEEKWAAVEGYMAPGATLGNTRPRADILSEQEVLIKAADYAYSIGALHSSFYMYEEDPRLLTAKIETPILLYSPDGSPGLYLLLAVDENGEALMDMMVRPEINVDYDSFERVRGGIMPNTPADLSSHFMTKHEILELAKAQFPDSMISEPMAVHGIFLEGQRHSNNAIFWYFTVTDNGRGTESALEEYIIDPSIMGYRNIAGGVANRSAISTGRGGSPYLGWQRMAKLETPLRLLDKIESARSAADTANIPYQREEIKYTPIPLR
jgi:hypothetical protein